MKKFEFKIEKLPSGFYATWIIGSDGSRMLWNASCKTEESAKEQAEIYFKVNRRN